MKTLTMEEKKQSKNLEITISFIQELKLDIQYQESLFAYGWSERSTTEKNKIGSELEHLQRIFLAIKQELKQ